MKSRLHLLFLEIPAGLTASVLLEGITQCLPPHYSVVSQSESDLAVGPFGLLESASLLARSLLTFAFLVAFASTVRAPARSRAGVSLVGVAATARVIIALFPTDLTPRPETLHGRVHAVAALVSFLGGAVGQLLIARRARLALGPTAPWPLLVGLAWGSIAGALVLVGTVAVSARIGVWGLLERAETVMGLAWIVIATVDLRRRSLEGQPSTRNGGHDEQSGFEKRSIA
jgi:hypothetical protein